MRHAHAEGAEGAARGGAPSPISVSRFDRPGRGVLPRDAPATCAGNRRRCARYRRSIDTHAAWLFGFKSIGARAARRSRYSVRALNRRLAFATIAIPAGNAACSHSFAGRRACAQDMATGAGTRAPVGMRGARVAVCHDNGMHARRGGAIRRTDRSPRLVQFDPFDPFVRRRRTPHREAHRPRPGFQFGGSMQITGEIGRAHV